MKKLRNYEITKTQKKSPLRRLILLFLSTIFSTLLTPHFTSAQEFESIKVFSEPITKELDTATEIVQCTKDLVRFLAPPNGDFYEDFVDYIQDFFLWPSHYADVAALSNQVDKAKYQVIAAYMRCNRPQLNQLINSYYALEAELYFVRHFVDTSNDWLRDRTKYPDDRKRFVDEMMESILPRMGEDDPNKARLSGYFDLFESKYKERVKSYGSFGEDDPVYDEFGKKLGELGDAFLSFGKIGSELADLGTEIGQPVADAAKGVYDAVDKGEAFQKIGSGFGSMGESLLNSFKLCPDSGDPADCKNVAQLGEAVGDVISDALRDEPGKKKTFEEVEKHIRQNEVVAAAGSSKAEMLARYELLYGQVNGDGVKSLMKRMDDLLDILEKGSLEPLNLIAQCADEVQGGVCGL